MACSSKDFTDRFRIKWRTIRGDALQCKFTCVKSGLEAGKETFDVSVRRTVVKHLISQPLEVAVVDNGENTKRTVIQLVGGDVSQKPGQRPLEIVALYVWQAFFPQQPRPNSVWLRTGQKLGGPATGARKLRDRGGHLR